MFVMMVLIVIVGTALDLTPTVLILTPVLMPVVLKAGIDPVYFGVMFIMNNAIGLITPPVGTVLNVVCGVARITMDDAFKGVMPFLLAQLAVLFLLVPFPDLVTRAAEVLHAVSEIFPRLHSKETTMLNRRTLVAIAAGALLAATPPSRSSRTAPSSSPTA
jgi:Na+/H+ antiporter NhaD/arsenite permease-like protein